MRKRLTAFLVLCGLCMTLFVPAANAVDSFTALFDIDGDGSIRTADARLVLRISVRLETPEVTAAAAEAGVLVFGDCNGDGLVSTADARILLRYAVGLCGQESFVLPWDEPGDDELVDNSTTKPPATEPPTTEAPTTTEPADSGFDPSSLPANALLSPYANHGLGTAAMIITTAAYAEMTPSGLNNMLSNAQTTPYCRGTIDYVSSGPSTIEGEAVYRLTSGVKIEAADVTYLSAGYRLPDNTVEAMGVACSQNATDLYIKTDWQVPVTFVSQTNANYSGREFSGEYTAAYIDLRFYNTTAGSGSLRFPATSVFSSAVWSTQSATKITNLRLYLSEAGAFYGCTVSMTDNGYFRISAKNQGTGLAGKTIVLDPGHGGSDPGGGYSGVYEAPINLNTAIYLKSLLEAAGATVVMTRSDNTNISLTERVDLTREVEADMFLSIHCDVATDSPSAAGVSVYYFYPWSKPYAQSLQDGLVNAYRSSVYSTSSANYSKVDRDIRFYAFQVARNEGCPAVLIELGFLTNSEERATLQLASTQQALARGIYNGLTAYYQ